MQFQIPSYADEIHTNPSHGWRLLFSSYLFFIPFSFLLILYMLLFLYVQREFNLLNLARRLMENIQISMPGRVATFNRNLGGHMGYCFIRASAKSNFKLPNPTVFLIFSSVYFQHELCFILHFFQKITRVAECKPFRLV